MGFLDRITGTRRPAADVVPQSAARVYGALLALNRPEAHFEIRDGRPHGADLVVDLKFADQDWYGFFSRLSLSTAFRILLRLDPQRHEVHGRDEEWQVEQLAGVFYYARQWRYERGRRGHQAKSWVFEGGRFRKEYDVSSGPVTEELIATTTSMGWTWRAQL
jgi:hypothetical protein